MRFYIPLLMAIGLAGCQFDFQYVLDNGRNGPPEVECLGAGCDNDRDMTADVPDDDDDDNGHGNDDDHDDHDDDDNPGKKKEK